MTPVEKGQILGNFRIVEKLGEGGMGEVFKGLDLTLEREVAIKLMRAELSRQPEIVARFRTEAVALARLSHSNIATLYSFGQEGNQYYMVLEFLRGESLDQLIARHQPLPWRRAADLASEALDGLEHAHRLGIIHRDVKPSNIMVTVGGHVKLMDFGIARILAREHLTRTGHIIGTLKYMSPEQIQDQTVTASSDLYAMGAVLYEMVCNRPPFVGNTDYHLIRAQVEHTPIAPHDLDPAIPECISRLIVRALAKCPEDRFASAADFSQQLRDALSPIGRSPESVNRLRAAPAEARYVETHSLRPPDSSPTVYRGPQEASATDRPRERPPLAARLRRPMVLAAVAGLLAMSLLALVVLRPPIATPEHADRESAKTFPADEAPDGPAIGATSVPRALRGNPSEGLEPVTKETVPTVAADPAATDSPILPAPPLPIPKGNPLPAVARPIESTHSGAVIHSRETKGGTASAASKPTSKRQVAKKGSLAERNPHGSNSRSERAASSSQARGAQSGRTWDHVQREIRDFMR